MSRIPNADFTIDYVDYRHKYKKWNGLLLFTQKTDTRVQLLRKERSYMSGFLKIACNNNILHLQTMIIMCHTWMLQ